MAHVFCADCWKLLTDQEDRTGAHTCAAQRRNNRAAASRARTAQTWDYWGGDFEPYRREQEEA